jgi:hypothetical protein
VTGSHYIAQAGLQFPILLPQPPECWNYRHAPLCLALGRVLFEHSVSICFHYLWLLLPLTNRAHRVHLRPCGLQSRKRLLPRPHRWEKKKSPAKRVSGLFFQVLVSWNHQCIVWYDLGLSGNILHILCLSPNHLTASVDAPRWG